MAVGTPITGRPPHRTVRAAFLHTAPPPDVWRLASAFRTRSGVGDTLSRHCVRHVRHRFAFSLASALRSTASAAGRPALFGGFIAVGSEEAPIEGLASVRRSNGTCSFPAFRFHEWLREIRREGISETRLTSLNSPKSRLVGYSFQPVFRHRLARCDHSLRTIHPSSISLQRRRVCELSVPERRKPTAMCLWLKTGRSYSIAVLSPGVSSQISASLRMTRRRGSRNTSGTAIKVVSELASTRLSKEK